MHEKERLEAAKFFFNKMLEHQGNPTEFCYYLDAFVYSADSVREYAEKESSHKSNGPQWRQGWVRAPDRKIGFFEGRRIQYYHHSPVKYEVRPTGRVCVTITVISPDTPLENIPQPDFPKSRKIYKYDSWRGKEDVLKLCKMYIKDLEDFISDGISKGYISG